MLGISAVNEPPCVHCVGKTEERRNANGMDREMRNGRYMYRLLFPCFNAADVDQITKELPMDSAPSYQPP